MQKSLRKSIYVVMLVIMIVILAVNYYLSGENLKNQQKVVFEDKLDQIVQMLQNNEEELLTLKERLEEDYLTRTRAFAYIIDQNPALLEQRSELLHIRMLLGVDELHVTDENGILVYSTVPAYIGMDFRDGEQMREFLQVLKSSDPEAFLVQKEQPNTAEGKNMQYIGVKRLDGLGFVQVGIEPKRILSMQKKNTYSYIFNRIPTDIGETLFAADLKTGRIVGHTMESKVGLVLEEVLEDTETLSKCRDGHFMKMDNSRKYVVTRQYGDILLGAAVTDKVMYESRGSYMVLTALYVLLTAGVIGVVMDRVIEKKVVNGVHRILEALEQIRNGNLETPVDVTENEELSALSRGINEMVEGILSTTVKLSRIIELTGMPIAVYECRNGVKKVMATTRLPEILEMDVLDVQILLSDCRMFQERLEEIRHNPVDGEKDVYQLGNDRYIKIRMSGDENGSYGTVTDVSDEIREKNHIRYVHDHDPLTGLNIYHAFKRKVEHCLKEQDELGCAAGVMIDLDHFKNINDSYGHDFGDSYLVRMAEVLRGISRNYGIAARRSGDEFCMFLYGFNSEDAIQEAMRLFYKLLKSARIFLPDGEETTISASSGIAYWEEGLNFETLMNRADCALYDAKRGGRNICREYQGKCRVEEKEKKS